MEGDKVQPRPLFHLLRILPTPVRWVGQEVVRFAHWLDHKVGRLFEIFRSSPAWSFVTLVGTIGVGLTILLFISVIEQTTVHHSKPTRRAIVHGGRDQLEKNYEWSAQDRWRVAHFFVPNKPAQTFKNILIDSRLMTPDTGPDGTRDPANSRRSEVAGRLPPAKDFEVRLETSRPRKAQQGKRLTAETTSSARQDRDGSSESRIHHRDPRLLVQAAWEFGPECCQTEYVQTDLVRNDHIPRPTRRPIPAPVPEPEIRPAPRLTAVPDISFPDISFEVAMIRHFTTSGPFPPGSHVISQSDRSEFPVDDPRYQNALVSYGDPVWQRADLTREDSSDEVIQYRGIASDGSISGMRPTSDEADPTLPSAAEVAMQLDLIVPRLAVGGRSHESKLIVRNEGSTSIPRIEILDLMPQSQTVVGATPDASVEMVNDPETGLNEKLLHRELLELPSGAEQEFSLRWIPEHGRRNHHRTRVIAEAAVSTTTEVELPEPDQQMPSIPPESPPEKHPALACDIDYPEKVVVGHDIEIRIKVSNTGDTTLHDVKVRIELPSQLSHANENEVVFDAGKLLVRGRAQTVVKLTASQVGDAVNVLRATAAEHVQARGRASILVVERPSEPAALAPIPEPIRTKPETISSPSRKPDSNPWQPTGRCCCRS